MEPPSLGGSTVVVVAVVVIVVVVVMVVVEVKIGRCPHLHGLRECNQSETLVKFETGSTYIRDRGPLYPYVRAHEPHPGLGVSFLKAC